MSDATSRQSLTEQLARYWSGARYEDLPQPVVAMAKSVLLDTLSVGVRGAESEAAVATRKGIASALECSSGSASLWGTRSSLPPSAAALVNGTASHALRVRRFRRLRPLGRRGRAGRLRDGGEGPRRWAQRARRARCRLRRRGPRDRGRGRLSGAQRHGLSLDRDVRHVRRGCGRSFASSGSITSSSLRHWESPVLMPAAPGRFSPMAR